MNRSTSVAGWAALLLFATTLQFVPINIFAENEREFGPAWRIWAPLGTLLVVALAGVVVATLIARLLPRRASYAFAWLVLWLGLATYVQAFFLNWSYGPLTGDAIDWRAFGGRGLVDIAVWSSIALLSLALLSRPRETAFGLAVLLLLQGGFALARLPWGAISGPGPAEAALDSRSRAARFSTKGNVLFVVLDAVQNDVAAEIFSERSDLRRAFDGFTFYSNAAGNFPTTEFSIGAMLSGVAWDQSVPKANYVSGPYAENTVLKAALNASYRTTFYSSKSQYCESVSGLSECQLYGELSSSRRRKAMIYQLLELSIFRASPQFIKEHIFADGKWLLSDRYGGKFASFHEAEVNTVRRFVSDLAVDDGPPTFKFFHLLLTHGPIRLNEACQWGVHENSRATYRMQQTCGLSLVADILTGMRRLGVYDNSMIVIAADHGVGFRINSSPFTGIAMSDVTQMQGPPDLAQNIPGTAYPMLMVKRSGERGGLRVDDTPIMSSDIAGLLCEAIRGCDLGRYVRFDDVPRERFRLFAYYDFRAIEADNPFFAPMTVFEIRGPVYDRRSWRSLGVRTPGTLAVSEEAGRRQ